MLGFFFLMFACNLRMCTVCYYAQLKPTELVNSSKLILWLISELEF